MTSTAKREAEKFEILDHHMIRITVVADGSFDKFQVRFDATMPASTPQDIVREVKNWQQAVALDYATAERFWSPKYIQHSALVPLGCEGLFEAAFPCSATSLVSER
jgi:hypothetical protein